MKLTRVAFFYLTAIIVSNIFRFDVFNLQPLFDKLPSWTIILYSPLQAIGVLAGALIALHFLKKEGQLEITVFGTSKKWSIVMHTTGHFQKTHDF